MIKILPDGVVPEVSDPVASDPVSSDPVSSEPGLGVGVADPVVSEPGRRLSEAGTGAAVVVSYSEAGVVLSLRKTERYIGKRIMKIIL